MADKTCSVYIIGHLIGGKIAGPCKVGVSLLPSARLLSLQTGNPIRLEFVFIFMAPTKEIALALELAFHVVLAEHRLEGEWFNVDPTHAVHAMCANIREHLATQVGLSSDDLSAALEASGVNAARQFMIVSAERLKAESDGTNTNN